MRVTRTIDETRAALADRPPSVFVPTMGALHEGHLSLMRRARELAPVLSVSIFVNPAQFGPGEDFARYPRPLETDLALCEAEGADVVFCPEPEAVYPPGELEVSVDVPALGAVLEGAHRPGHFAGVCRVVAKLLNIVRPAAACFGRKDYQQLKVIEAMVDGLCLPVSIERCPIVRDADGLALSSRNAYLDDAGRRRALSLSAALREARRLIEGGERRVDAVESRMRVVLTEGGVAVDYAVVREARTLSEIEAVDAAPGRCVCLLAGHVDRVRLIDNWLCGETF